MTYKVAIIEDSIVLRDMLSELLHDIRNTEITATASGQKEALSTLRDSHVDLVIVDLELKEGTGLGVIKALRADPHTFGNPKTVVFSNYAISPMSRRCRDLGVNHIFDKSFQLPELLSFVADEVKHLPPREDN